MTTNGEKSRRSGVSWPVVTLRRRMLQVLLSAAAAYGLLCLLMFLFQRKLVYLPGGPPLGTPESAGLAFDDLHLVTEDGETLHAWRTRAPGKPTSRRGLVLYGHGNAGNIEYRIGRAAACAAMGYDCLLFDYRGFGHSTGSPTEAGTYLDVLAAYDWAVGDGGYAPREIVGFGESLGCAVIVELACRRELAGMILESPFASLPDMGAALYPFLPVRLIARDQYASIDKVGELELPMFLMHSPADEIVPFEQGRRLAAAANTALHELSGGHNGGGFLRRESDRHAVARFLEQVTASVHGPVGPGATDDG